MLSIEEAVRTSIKTWRSAVVSHLKTTPSSAVLWDKTIDRLVIAFVENGAVNEYDFLEILQEVGDNKADMKLEKFWPSLKLVFKALAAIQEIPISAYNAYTNGLAEQNPERVADAEAAIRAWRTGMARKYHKPPYCFLRDALLMRIAAKLPTTVEEIQKTGLKNEEYAKGVLEALRDV